MLCVVSAPVVSAPFSSSIMLFLGVIIFPIIVLKIATTFPGTMHKKFPLGRKGDCIVIAHRGSREEGSLDYHLLSIVCLRNEPDRSMLIRTNMFPPWNSSRSA